MGEATYIDLHASDPSQLRAQKVRSAISGRIAYDTPTFCWWRPEAYKPGSHTTVLDVNLPSANTDKHVLWCNCAVIRAVGRSSRCRFRRTMDMKFLAQASAVHIDEKPTYEVDDRPPPHRCDRLRMEFRSSTCLCRRAYGVKRFDAESMPTIRDMRLVHEARRCFRPQARGPSSAARPRRTGSGTRASCCSVTRSLGSGARRP